MHLSFPDLRAKKVIKNNMLHWIDTGAVHVKKNKNERKQKELQELEQEEMQGKKRDEGITRTEKSGKNVEIS